MIREGVALGLYDDPRRWMERVGESADLYRLKLRLEKKGSDWLVSRAVLGRFTGVSFKE